MALQCAYITGYSGMGITLVPMAQTPTDLSTCAQILMSGSDYQAMHQSMIDSAVIAAATSAQLQIQNNALPFDYSIASEAFAFGFIPVLTLYLTSHMVGVVLKMIKR
jgi:hypothetical protein